MFKRISVEEAHSLITDAAAQIADIRDEISYEAAHITGAIHLSNSNLQDFIEHCDPQRCTVVYCYHGISSQSAAAYLCEKGFCEVYSLDGGFEAWHAAYGTNDQAK